LFRNFFLNRFHRDVQCDDDQSVRLTGLKVDDISVTRLFLSAS
jgi:hypothetical protein